MSFNISIHDDDLYENNENFTLIINTDSLPDGIITGSPSRAAMIIINDGKCMESKLAVVSSMHMHTQNLHRDK